MLMRGERAENFVLWGHHCDEAAAVIFVTTLREVGLRVKVVGISGRRHAGAHGLTLTPDLTLSQALPLAMRARCVIIPCDFAQLTGFLNDPRLRQFLAGAQTAQATFVVSEASLMQADPLWVDVEALLTYPTGAALISFAQTLAAGLAQG
jgi:hypothetical protein